MKSRATPSGRRWGTFPQARRTPGLSLRLAALPLTALALAACGDDHVQRYPQTTWRTVTDFGDTQMGLFRLTMWLGIAVGVLVFALMAYICLKYRYRPEAPEPEQTHGNTRLEIAWTLIPAVILAVIAIPTVHAIFSTQPDIQKLPANTLTVDVIGKQWWWEFRYLGPGGRDTIVSANEVHVESGRPVHLRLLSDNVLHSFWIPQMGGKRDVIPNRANHLVFTPREEGVYLGACAEFCGDSHALMKMRMIVHTPEGFQRWLANEAAPAVNPVDSVSAVGVGKKLVTQGACAGCHTIKGTTAVGITGPNLTHVGRRLTIAGGILDNNAQNLTEWIANAPAIKPGSKMPPQGTAHGGGLTDEQIRYVVAYLQSLQ